MLRTARFAALVGLAVATAARAADVTIAAAISLRDVLEDARPLLEKAAGRPVQFTFGASGTLRLQVERGAPVDLFISADRANSQRLVAEGQATPGTARTIAANRLVVVVPKDNPAHLRGLADLVPSRVTHVAIGEPAAVPAGKYARQTLEHEHLYAGLKEHDKLVLAENVAQVLTLVTRGEVDAGLVYSSDAEAAGDRVNVIAQIPADSHDPIVYEMVIPKSPPHPALAAKLQAVLQSPPFEAILTRRGFAPPEKHEAQEHPLP